MAQRQVIEILNQYFVPYELDATGGIPEGVPALAALRKSYGQIPWTRVSFGSEFVIDPEGEYILSLGFSKHRHAVQRRGGFAALFQQALEESLERLARIRAHERGSPGEREELLRLSRVLDHDLKERRPCALDVDLFTECTLKVLWGGDSELFERKLSGVFRYPDPVVRRQLAGTLGRYADHRGNEFQSSEDGFFLAERVARLLTDPDASVRLAAAVASYQFAGHPAPAAMGEDLVSSARDLWDRRVAGRP